MTRHPGIDGSFVFNARGRNFYPRCTGRFCSQSDELRRGIVVADTGLRPIIDSGSSRVFDCNRITRKLRETDAAVENLFFRNPQLNNLIVVKHSVPASDRQKRNTPPVGTKLYFPFDENDPYRGGSTIFLHDKNLEAALQDKCGVSRENNKQAVEQDIVLLKALGRLPTLDPFLMRDVLAGEKLEVNAVYLDISTEEWNEIEIYIHDHFMPLVRAAVPGAAASHDQANRLAEKMWEATDRKALQPLIVALRLPEANALDIFYSWKVITFYAFQYARLKPKLLEMAQWLKTTSVLPQLTPPDMRMRIEGPHATVREQIRQPWRVIETTLTAYENSYATMFREKGDPGPFLAFIGNASETFWLLGDALGKIDHAVFCWDSVTARYSGRSLPLEGLENALRMLEEILGTGKADPVGMVWGAKSSDNRQRARG
jgi:hypothetical protein